MAATLNNFKRTRVRLPAKLDDGVAKFVGDAYVKSTNCIDFNGSDEYIGDQGVVNMEFGAAWTMMLWYKQEAANTTNGNLFSHSGSGSGNKTTFRLSSTATGRLDVTIKGEDGVKTQFVRDDSYFNADSNWHQLIVTHTTAVCFVYRDASQTGTDIEDCPTDDTDTRAVYQHGAKFDGRIHAMAIWKVVLDSDNRTAIYNGGDADVDLGEDAGNYDESANLMHWWRHGNDDSDVSNLAPDEGFGTNLMDLMTNTANITVADDVKADSPT